jgi:membrane fusion protein
VLFRQEAARARQRLQGEVSLAPPVSWQVMGFFLGAILILAAAFLSLATYGRRVTAQGTIEGDKGVVQVTAGRAGTLARMLVHEGEDVRAGQVLARVAFATASRDGTLEARRSAAVAAELRATRSRTPAVRAATQARVAALEADTRGSRSQLAQLRDQMTQQDELIRSAQEDLDRARALAGGGFVSGHDLRQREQVVSERRQAMMRLHGDEARLVAQVEHDAADIARERADLDTAEADAARTRGELAARSASDDAQPWIEVVAPVAGRVTGLVQATGDRVAADRSLLSLVPTGTRLVARLSVPVAGVGFVRPGQNVAIALDAFPRELFGTVAARIAYVTAASITERGRPEASFVAEAPLDQPSVAAYGARYPLRPGMTLSATITTRRLSLLRWLLDPLFAVANR